MAGLAKLNTLRDVIRHLFCVFSISMCAKQSRRSNVSSLIFLMLNQHLPGAVIQSLYEQKHMLDKYRPEVKHDQKLVIR